MLPPNRPHHSRKLLSRRWPLDTFPPVRFLTQETIIPGLMVRTDSTPDEHREGRRSNTRDTVTGAVRLALDITESLSDGVPFLPGAVKALKTVVEAYEV